MAACTFLYYMGTPFGPYHQCNMRCTASDAYIRLGQPCHSLLLVISYAAADEALRLHAQVLYTSLQGMTFAASIVLGCSCAAAAPSWLLARRVLLPCKWLVAKALPCQEHITHACERHIIIGYDTCHGECMGV